MAAIYRGRGNLMRDIRPSDMVIDWGGAIDKFTEGYLRGDAIRREEEWKKKQFNEDMRRWNKKMQNEDRLYALQERKTDAEIKNLESRALGLENAAIKSKIENEGWKEYMEKFSEMPGYGAPVRDNIRWASGLNNPHAQKLAFGYIEKIYGAEKLELGLDAWRAQQEQIIAESEEATRAAEARMDRGVPSLEAKASEAELTLRLNQAKDDEEIRTATKDARQSAAYHNAQAAVFKAQTGETLAQDALWLATNEDIRDAVRQGAITEADANLLRVTNEKYAQQVLADHNEHVAPIIKEMQANVSQIAEKTKQSAFNEYLAPILGDDRIMDMQSDSGIEAVFTDIDTKIDEADLPPAAKDAAKSASHALAYYINDNRDRGIGGVAKYVDVRGSILKLFHPEMKKPGKDIAAILSETRKETDPGKLKMANDRIRKIIMDSSLGNILISPNDKSVIELNHKLKMLKQQHDIVSTFTAMRGGAPGQVSSLVGSSESPSDEELRQELRARGLITK